MMTLRSRGRFRVRRLSRVRIAVAVVLAFLVIGMVGALREFAAPAKAATWVVPVDQPNCTSQEWMRGKDGHIYYRFNLNPNFEKHGKTTIYYPWNMCPDWQRRGTRDARMARGG